MSSGKKDVVILMGGASAEREVSLVSGRAVMEAIDTERYNARTVEVGAAGRIAARANSSGSQQQLSHSVSTLESDRCEEVSAAHELAHELTRGGRLPDVVFVAMHGRYGEDGTVQGLLELLGVPYTGSGVLASALAMDKLMSKRIFHSAGIPTPRWLSISRQQYVRFGAPDVGMGCGFPAIIKPNREGSTIGCTRISSQREVEAALEEALRHDEVALIEEYVEGVELTAGILGDRPPQVLPLVEIRPKTGFYDYEAKYTAGLTEKIVPAQISESVARHTSEIAQQVHTVIGCSGMSRVDFIVTSEGPTVLEVNTIPGMTPTSLLPRAAQAAGIAFTDMITRIIESGLEEGVR
ncbi:MAG: D-alanine--D-alanine ligase [Armatimonadetes bacterium]|nr:D-alanine--D-alanine ligase [Armatimonadota bacterium]